MSLPDRSSGDALEIVHGKGGGKIILALDASHNRGSVAVCSEDETLSEILFDASDTHSATLMPAVDYCLRSAKLSIGDIGLMAVVYGPGSFTGLRIALATVKGLAAARGIGVVAVNSLETIAAALPYARFPVLALIDARRGEVYGALYETGSGIPEEVIPCFAAPPGEIPVMIGKAAAEPLLICGTGALRYREQLSLLLDPGSIFAPAKWALPSASVAAILSLRKRVLAKEDLVTLEPLYIRPPDAKLPSDAILAEGGDDGLWKNRS